MIIMAALISYKYDKNHDYIVTEDGIMELFHDENYPWVK